jgi:Chitobiase/beta-hexosaminidase C-terminal domain
VLLKTWSIGETYDLYPGDSSSSKAGFIFNNVTNSDINNVGGNCFLVEGNDAGGAGPFYYFNNTSTNACQMRNPGRGSNTATFENDHFVGYSPSGAISDFSSVTNTDNDHHLWQSTATANGQGYTVGNNWAPTSGGGSTVGAGANLSSTVCSLMDNNTASTACKEALPAAGPITYNSGPNTVTDNALVVRGTTWDIGAYQFTASQAAAPTCSPTAGTYTSTQSATCSNPNSGTTVICYTLNGTTPATNGAGTACTTGTAYSTSTEITATETLEAIAGTSTLTDSSTVSYAYVLQGSAPTFSPGAGSYSSTQSVTISQAQSLGMCYTTDNSTPTSNGSGACSHGTTYTVAVSVSSSETLKAIAMSSGWTDSSVGSAVYTITGSAASTVFGGGITTSGGVVIH